MQRDDQAPKRLTQSEIDFRAAIFKVIAISIISVIFGATLGQMVAVILCTELIVLVFTILKRLHALPDEEDDEDERS